MERTKEIELLRDLLGRDGWSRVVKPRLQGLMASLERHWLNNTRPKGSENLSDEGLKNRIYMIVWMLEWEDRLANLLELQATDDELTRIKIDEGEGGSPY